MVRVAILPLFVFAFLDSLVNVRTNRRLAIFILFFTTKYKMTQIVGPLRGCHYIKTPKSFSVISIKLLISTIRLLIHSYSARYFRSFLLQCSDVVGANILRQTRKRPEISVFQSERLKATVYTDLQVTRA